MILPSPPVYTQSTLACTAIQAVLDTFWFKDVDAKSDLQHCTLAGGKKLKELSTWVCAIHGHRYKLFREILRFVMTTGCTVRVMFAHPV